MAPASESGLLATIGWTKTIQVTTHEPRPTMAPSPSTPKALRRSRERRKMTSSEATSEVAPSSEKIPERTVDSLLEPVDVIWASTEKIETRPTTMQIRGSSRCLRIAMISVGSRLAEAMVYASERVSLDVPRRHSAKRTNPPRK